MGLTDKDDALQRFETVWEHVECGICIIDATTREILDINPVAARMFGDDKSKIIGNRCHRFICPAECDSCPIMDRGQVVDRSERKFVKANGETIPIIKSVAKIQYNGRLALLESFTDLSSLKEAEAALLQLRVTEQANHAKSDFLSRMSHEMRTPMNAIIGMTKIAEHTDDLGKLKHCLSMIGISSAHLLGLINDVLDMSKIEAGKFELDVAPFNVEKMVAKTCSLVQQRAEDKGIGLYVSFAKNMRMDYTGDELRLSQVLLNLLSNAVKFTPRGGQIRLDAEEAGASGNASGLRFSVTDSGIGMTKEQISKLFNAFEQADSSISRRFGGTGLGLVISKNIAEKMNGNITVESEPGRGAKFVVQVEVAGAQPGQRTVMPVLCRRGLRILVVDADEESRRRFRAASEFCVFAPETRRGPCEQGPPVAPIAPDDGGLLVDEAASGAAALAMLSKAKNQERPYHLLFMAHELPDMDPLDFAARLEAYLDKNSVIVMASFLQWSKIDTAALELGITRFLPKPFFPSQVMTALDGQLEPASGPVLTAQNNVCDMPDFSGLTLLLAEDVDINREIFCSLLEDTGVSIDCAENGVVAVEKFINNPDKYDLIIMDVQMPDMDGHEATRAIRALDFARASAIPIVAMTANVFQEDVEKCLASGMNDHLAKPIDEKVVFEKIRLYCGR